MRLLARGVAAGDDRDRGFDDTAVAAKGEGKRGRSICFFSGGSPAFCFASFCPDSTNHVTKSSPRGGGVGAKREEGG